MLEMIRGCGVPDAERLCEEYTVKDGYIMANVSRGRIEEVFQHFCAVQQERLYFFIEIPTSEEDEKRLRKNDSDPYHNDVYYIDGLFNEQALIILLKYSELLINDGVSKFGFGAHDGTAELMKDKYNIMVLWAENMEQYGDFFDVHDIHVSDNYISAWDTFSEEHSGQCRSIKINGVSVYDLPEKLKDMGMYFAEYREV